MGCPGRFNWENVSLLEDDVDEIDDVPGLIRASLGSGRRPPRRSNDYRRQSDEDGYGEIDFA